MSTAAPHTPPAAPGSPRPARRGTPQLLVAAAAAALLIVLAVVLSSGGQPPPATGDTGGTTLELSLGSGGDALASCLPLDPQILATMSPAFAATATAYDGQTVTLSVDRWYAGEQADTVILDAPPGLEALIAGFDFQVGESYLITASQGTVNYCGFSGPATPELQAAFDAAFGA